MDLSRHHQELQDTGYTIVQNLIDLNFVDELVDEIKKLEVRLQRAPDNNRFEGNQYHY